MAALTAARNSVTMRTRSGDLLLIPMAADARIFNGGLVNINAAGYAVAASDTADHKCAGVAVDHPQNAAANQPGSCYNNLGGSNGDKEIAVLYPCRARFHLYETPVQAMLFAQVYVYDDQTVAVGLWNVANDVRSGHIVRMPGTTLAAHPETQLGSDEVEIEFSGEPFIWIAGTTTAAPTTTTTTRGGA